MPANVAPKIPEFIEVTDTALRYHLHPGQIRAWDATARFILVLAGAQSGKTCLAPIWLAREIAKHPPCQFEGEADYLVASATYDLLDLKLRPAMTYYFCELTKWGKWKAASRLIESNHDRSRIIFRSAENPESLESCTAPAAVLDEFGQARVPLAAWEAVQRRLAIYEDSRALFLTTPYEIGWLKQQVYDRAMAGDPDFAVVNYSSIENPRFPREAYERAKRTLPTWKFEMFYNGRFTNPAGMIYNDFRDSYAPTSPPSESPDNAPRILTAIYQPGQHGHLVKPFTIPPAWNRLIGIDFGGAEHQGVLWLAEEQSVPPDSYLTGNYIAFREVLGGGRSGAEHARRILDYGEKLHIVVGGSRSEKQARLAWQQEGLPVAAPMIYELEPGIDLVVALFRQNRLFIMETLPLLRHELSSYSRELDDNYQPTLQILNKDTFHMLDCLRSVVSYIPHERPELPPDTEAARIERMSGRTVKAIREHAKLLQ